MQNGCCALGVFPSPRTRACPGFAYEGASRAGPTCDGKGVGVGVVVISLSMSWGIPSLFDVRPICTKPPGDMSSCPYCHPHPQPLPTASRACPTCALMRETRASPGFVGRGAHRVCRLTDPIPSLRATHPAPVLKVPGGMTRMHPERMSGRPGCRHKWTRPHNIAALPRNAGAWPNRSRASATVASCTRWRWRGQNSRTRPSERDFNLRLDGIRL